MIRSRWVRTSCLTGGRAGRLAGRDSTTDGERSKVVGPGRRDGMGWDGKGGLELSFLRDVCVRACRAQQPGHAMYGQGSG